jgi:hypothetical protein
MGKMEERQRQELLQLEQMQKTQFNDFTAAWDQYMIDYELAAYQSIERMKKEHSYELETLKTSTLSGLARYKMSKKLVEYRGFESMQFAAKNYDGASKYKRLADELEVMERKEQEEKMILGRSNVEAKLKKTHFTQLSSLLKRIQRDRDE